MISLSKKLLVDMDSHYTRGSSKRLTRLSCIHRVRVDREDSMFCIHSEVHTCAFLPLETWVQ